MDIELNHETVPTCVALADDGQTIVIGEAARREISLAHSNARSFKSSLGEGTKVSEEKRYWMTPTGKTGNDLRTFTPKEVAQIFLKELLAGIPTGSQLIIGIPAVKDDGWVNRYKLNVRSLTEELGYQNPVWLYEPFAVYQYYRSLSLGDDLGNDQQTVLVVDIGGGTLNCCVLRTTKAGKIPLAGVGATPLGLQAEFVGGCRAHRLLSADGIPIDIVPFGDIASEAGNIRWPDESDVEMSVLGFDEARAHAEVVRICEEPALDIPVASPVGLLLLKLVAWGDRDRDLRVKDALDIRHLFENYSHLLYELTGIWDDIPRLEQFDGDIDLVAASLLGGATRRIASTATLERLTQLLSTRHDALVLDMDSVRATSPSQSATLLSAFETGFGEGPGSQRSDREPTAPREEFQDDH